MTPVWRDGWMDGFVDAEMIRREGLMTLELGEAWLPPIFPPDHEYADEYRTIARGEVPGGYHAWRVRADRFHEVYGIPPTLAKLRERMRRTADLDCRFHLDLESLRAFDGAVGEHGEGDDAWLASALQQVMVRQDAVRIEEIDRTALDPDERRALEAWRRRALAPSAIRAIQERLVCDGHLRRRAFRAGRLDDATLAALAEFERRHRIYARGSTSGETLEALQTEPWELERRDVIRVLVERAMLGLGFVEDGTADVLGGEAPPTFRGRDGEMHQLRNLEEEVRGRVVAAFGLQDPESTLYWLDSLGDLPEDESRVVALPGVQPPEYHSAAMELEVVIDRGDVWYDFPFDAEGRAIPQPVQVRPTLTLFARYDGQVIPLARWPTTIGGWHLVEDRGTQVWRYKESPIGMRWWQSIVSAPVWLPPNDVLPQKLIVELTENGETRREVNYNLTGPSYASAFGPIAAYHRVPSTGADEGIRTHGTGDYTSMLLGRASSGCHRLQNHRAVRLFTFVLAHRLHRRVGHRAVNYRRSIVHEGATYEVRIARSGYQFELRQPLPVTVLPGRILGAARRPITDAVPRRPE